MKKEVQKPISTIDFMGLTLIGMLSLGYCLFFNYFAQLHIELPFFDFPIFIGEIVLVFLIGLVIVKWKIDKWEIVPYQKFGFWLYIMLESYLVFILIKAFLGYLNWGPLALRQSALFYYPLFVFLGYSFYRRDFFDKKMILFLIILFLVIFKTINAKYIFFYGYSAFTCMILVSMLIKIYPRRILKYLFIVILGVIAPYKLFYQSSRTMLVSNIICVVFIGLGLFFILRMKRKYKVRMLAIFSVLIFLGLFRFGDSHALQSILNIKETVRRYILYRNAIVSIEPEFETVNMKRVKLYSEDQPIYKAETISEKNLTSEEAQAYIKQFQAIHVQLREKEKVDKLEEQIEADNHDTGLRNLKSAYTNSIFRILIWHDLVEELIAKKPVLGLEFGKPFRSKSIEILGMAYGEWSRDGWIAIHNSYLNMIYRAGIIGVLLILTVFWVFFKMVTISIRLKTVNGILLCSILLNWLIAANFMLVLELPYTAIPFWSLFGMTFCYLKNVEKRKTCLSKE
jgi:hypothetical protein